MCVVAIFWLEAFSVSSDLRSSALASRRSAASASRPSPRQRCHAQVMRPPPPLRHRIRARLWPRVSTCLILVRRSPTNALARLWPRSTQRNLRGTLVETHEDIIHVRVAPSKRFNIANAHPQKYACDDSCAHHWQWQGRYNTQSGREKLCFRRSSLALPKTCFRVAAPRVPPHFAGLGT